MHSENQIKKVTSSKIGHMIHHNSVFSSDGQWIVFDGRNDETKINETTHIGIVNVGSGIERIIYETKEPTKYGPGVGAASFSPTRDRVVFIHGLYEANEQQPYDISRRFGLGVDIDTPNIGIPMDARDIISPYTLGTLRGGTHSHCWNSDGTMLSFTYNDALVDSDLRRVGVMFPSQHPIDVESGHGNVDGNLYSVILSEVVRNPTLGSDEISKAFDECWLGTNTNIIAFQGNTLNQHGEVITEIFTVEFDTSLILDDLTSIGQKGEWPMVPKGVKQKRISNTKLGLSDFRHWLRSSPDGQYIYALAKDEEGRNQLVQCTVADGKFDYISDFNFSISSPININSKGDLITFIANNNIYIYDIHLKNLSKLTNYELDQIKLLGAPVFSPTENSIAFNVIECNATNTQINLVFFN